MGFTSLHVCDINSKFMGLQQFIAEEETKELHVATYNGLRSFNRLFPLRTMYNSLCSHLKELYKNDPEKTVPVMRIVPKLM